MRVIEKDNFDPLWTLQVTGLVVLGKYVVFVAMSLVLVVVQELELSPFQKDVQILSHSYMYLPVFSSTKLCKSDMCIALTCRGNSIFL